MRRIITNRESEFMKIGWNDFCEVNECILECSMVPEIQVDMETTGMSFMDSTAFALQLGIEGNQFLIDLETVDILQFKTLLEEKLLLFQNGLFDLCFLYKGGIIPNHIYDTLLAEQCLSLGVLNYKRGLGSLVKRYLNKDIDKGMQANIANTGILDLDAINYSFEDVVHLSAIKRAQTIAAQEKGVGKHIRLENRFVRVLAYVEFSGIYFDKDAWMDVARHNEYLEYDAILKLKAYIQENLGIEADEENLNLNSQKQMIEIFTKMGIDVYDSKEGKYSLNKDLLKKKAHKFVDMYLDFKRKAKQVNTYGRNWFNAPFEDSRIHTKFKQLVSTGRMSCGNKRAGDKFVNLQNIPRNKKMREAFKGQRQNVLITSDYSGQESVIMADKSKEPKLLEFFKNGGGDLHSYVSKQVWNDKLGDLPLQEIEKQYPELRQKAKSANFAISFGGNGYTIAENLNIPVEEGERVYDAFMQAFPGLTAYFKKTAAEALKKGYILINEKTGGKRFIEGMKEYARSGADDPYFEGTVFRLSLNTPVQATAAMITKTAGILFFDWILENKRFGKTKIVNIVHDEYVVEENSRKAEDTAKVLKECMEKAGDIFLDELALYAEPKIGKAWAK